MTQRERDHILDYYRSLTDEELENERFTLEHEFRFLDMSKAEAIDRANAIEIVQHGRRSR